MCAMPPKIQSWMLEMPIPLRIAGEGVAELVQDDRAEEAEGADHGEGEGRRGRAALAEHVAVEVREPEDHQEEDEEPGPVDRDADSADVKKGDRAAAEHVAW